ncbi:hypothetical protein SprV_0401556000 [Sparganum proliferum]
MEQPDVMKDSAVFRELTRKKVDIADLDDTRFFEQNQLKEGGCRLQLLLERLPKGRVTPHQRRSRHPETTLWDYCLQTLMRISATTAYDLLSADDRVPNTAISIAPDFCIPNRNCPKSTASAMTTTFTTGGHNSGAPTPSATAISVIPVTTSKAAEAVTTTNSFTPVTGVNPPDAPSTTALINTILTSNDVWVPACPHCGRVFTSRIDLVGHSQIHRTAIGAPVPGAPQHTLAASAFTVHTVHAHPFIHRINLFCYMRIHNRESHRNIDTPS